MANDEFITPEEWAALVQAHGPGADWRMYGKDLVIFACIDKEGDAEVRVYSVAQIQKAFEDAWTFLHCGACNNLATGLLWTELDSLV